MSSVDLTLSSAHIKTLIQIDPRVAAIQARYPESKKVVNLPQADKSIIQEAAEKAFKALNKRFLDPSMPARACRYCSNVPAAAQCTVCHEPYCGAACQKEDWKAHRPFCLEQKQLAEKRTESTLATLTFDGLWSLLVQHAYAGQLEFFSLLSSSLGLFTPTPLHHTHTLLIRLRYDPSTPDPTLAFPLLGVSVLPHAEVRAIVRRHPSHDDSTDVGLGELGHDDVRMRGEFKASARIRDDCWYAAAVFFVEEGFEKAVVTTRYVEMKKQEKPDFKTQNTKHWEENYRKCMALSGTPIKQPWGLSSPRQDEWLRQSE